MGYGSACVRWSFVAYALFLGLVSAATTVFAAYILIEVLSHGYFLDVRVVAAPSIALLLGALLLLPLIVLLGFRAFTSQRSSLAIVFWVLVAMSAVLSMVLGGWTLILRQRVLAGHMADKIVNSVLRESPNSLIDQDTKHYWDALQNSMKCCGLNGVSDYKAAGAIPMSCCDVVEQICSKTYPRGCSAALTEFAAVKLAEITIVATIIALILFVGIYSGCSYSNSIRKLKKKKLLLQNISNEVQVREEAMPFTIRKSRIPSLPPAPRDPPPAIPPKPSPRYARSSSKRSTIGWDETSIMKVDPKVPKP